MALNDKQKRFCREYVIDLNATQAAIRSGYSKKTCGSIGNALLQKVEIQTFIKKLQVKIQERTEITADKIVQELAKIGFSNIQDLMQEGFEFKDIISLKPEKSAVIQSVKCCTTTRMLGEIQETTKEVQVKVYDKISALEKIGRHIGMFKDKLDITTNGESLKPQIKATLADGTILEI